MIDDEIVFKTESGTWTMIYIIFYSRNKKRARLAHKRTHFKNKVVKIIGLHLLLPST